MQRPQEISIETWRKLKLRERAIVYYSRKLGMNKKKVMRKTFIDSDRTYRALMQRIRKKIIGQ